MLLFKPSILFFILKVCCVVLLSTLSTYSNENVVPSFPSIVNKLEENNLPEGTIEERVHEAQKRLFESNVTNQTKEKKTLNPNTVINTFDFLSNRGKDQYLKEQFQQALQKQILDRTRKEYTKILSQWGNVSLDLNLAKDLQLAVYKLLYLVPLYDSSKYVIFNQMGYNYTANQQNFFNFGLGIRAFSNNVLGANFFLDYDLISHHSRASIGIETASNLFRFSSNYYLPLSNWKETGQYDIGGYGFLNKPSSGFDISLKGYFPYEKTLSGEISYHKWFGFTPEYWDNSKVTNIDLLRRNANTINSSISWNPIPLVATKLSYTNLLANVKPELSATVNLNWNLDEPIFHRISRGQALDDTTIAGMHRAFVKRNDYMVMAYKIPPKPIIAKSININPGIQKHGNYYDSTLRTKVHLEIIPLTERKKIIPNVSDKISIRTCNNANIVTFDPIIETNSPGIYHTAYTGNELGIDDIEVQYNGQINSIPIHILPITSGFEFIPNTPKNNNGSYVSPVGTTINLQIIPHDAYGNKVLGIAHELEIKETANSNVLIFPSNITEQGNTGIYETSYRGINPGVGEILIKHFETEQLYLVDILTKIRRIDLTANAVQNSLNQYNFVLNELTILTIVPYNQYGEVIPKIPPNQWTIETNDNRVLDCFPTIVETSQPGVYKAVCKALQLGNDVVSISYDNITNTLPVIIGTNVKGISIFTNTSTDTAGFYQTRIGETIDMTITPYDEQGNALSGIRNELSFQYTGVTGLIDYSNIRDDGQGVYSATYMGKTEGTGTLSIQHNGITLNQINIEVVDVASIELKPITTYNTTRSLHESGYKETVELQVIPLTANGRVIPNLLLRTLTISSDKDRAIEFGALSETTIPGVYSIPYKGKFLGDNRLIASYKNGAITGSTPISIVPPRVFTLTFTPSIQLDPVTNSYDSYITNNVIINFNIVDADAKPIPNLEQYLNFIYSGTNTINMSTITAVDRMGNYTANYNHNGRGSGTLNLESHGHLIHSVQLKAFDIYKIKPDPSVNYPGWDCANCIPLEAHHITTQKAELDTQHFHGSLLSKKGDDKSYDSFDDVEIGYSWLWIQSCMDFWNDCSDQKLIWKTKTGKTISCVTHDARECKEEYTSFNSFLNEFINNPPSCTTYDAFKLSFHGYETSGANGNVDAKFLYGPNFSKSILVGKGFCDNLSYTSGYIHDFEIFYRCYE